ncbi:MAG: MogA/MoaB family molybdenum cofactor biosynthesis protein [Candidatus Schekmanbacteria bacterium]|nr:MAG: MogA/MoaB family molybdenum cofactor biosynthesis protein [Candidatus Schekmanbacteria bacterium]
MGHKEHKEKAKIKANCFVITVSDSRTDETDTSGKLIVDELTKAGHSVLSKIILPDEPQLIKNTVLEKTSQNEIDAIILNGGTGISLRDSTFEAIEGIFDKRLSGFGEIFRYLSYKDIGSAAIMSRATAGIKNGKVIISIPGSRGAVSLALEKLIIPELSHILWELRKHLPQNEIR